MSTRPHASPSSRILIRGLNWLGDAVMATPMLFRLREAFPQAHLAVLTQAKLAPLYENHPSINHILRVEKSLWATARLLRKQSFDVAVVLPNSFRSALEMFLARIRQRVGYAATGRAVLLTHPVSRSPDFRPMHKRSPSEVRQLIKAPGKGMPRPPLTAHHIHHYLRLASELGASSELCPPRLAVTEEELSDFCARFTVPAGQILLGLCPGAEYGSSKRWPYERYVAAATAIQKVIRCRLIIFGTDTELGHRMATQLPQAVHDLTGQTTLRQLLAGLKLCQLVLTNDSGPMHAAAALDTPVVVPFGSTSPELTGPGLPGSPGHVVVRANVPCSPCFLRDCPIDHRCMNDIPVEAVVEAALARLS